VKSKKDEYCQIKKGPKVNPEIKYAVSFILAFFIFHSPLPTHNSRFSFAGETDTNWGATLPGELPGSPMPQTTPQLIEAGKKIYDFRCAPCHGFEGKGDGAAAMTLDPRPRDFTRGLYKFKSTPDKQVVADEDLFRTISRGIPGSAMPSWKRLLSEEERWQVIAYIKTFSDRFEKTGKPTPVKVGSEPPMTPESIAKGKEIFQKTTKPPCAQCHGDNGRGNGILVRAVTNSWGEPLLPRNLTQPWTYKSGNTATDIYLRDHNGIEGTMMPAYADQFSEEERWQLAHFVKSLQKEREPGSKVNILSGKIDQEIPMDPDDPFWQGIDRVDIRMTGQVHVPPRNQNPVITNVRVRSVYTDQEIAFHLEWDDRIKNDKHLANELSERWEVPDFTETYPVLYPPSIRPHAFRDAAAIQFPVTIPEGPVKPHFFLGDARKPVNLWHWKADTEKPEESNAAGYAKPAEVQPDETQQLESQSVFSDGQWRVVIKRPLITEDAANDIQFVPGKMIPVAFHVWDGFSGETGLRRTISSWYFVLLEATVTPRVYVMTVTAIGLTAVVQFWLIRRIKRKGS
jgi:mono/diheme cytochrome c family protein